MSNALVDFWRKAPLDVAPYVHPEDVDILKKYRHGQYFNYQLLDIESFDQPGEHQTDPRFLHLSLLPVPYVGNLEKADVFILMTNPGFGGIEYKWESGASRQDVIRKNCHQYFQEGESPFLFAREGWKNHPGYNYWKDNMKVLRELDLDFEVFMQRVAILQMVAYHSKDATMLGRLPQNLPSSRIAAQYAQTLYERAKGEEILLLVKRQVKNWGFDELCESNNIVISRQPFEYRSSHFGTSENNRHSQAIKKWIEKHPC